MAPTHDWFACPTLPPGAEFCFPLQTVNGAHRAHCPLLTLTKPHLPMEDVGFPPALSSTHVLQCSQGISIAGCTAAGQEDLLHTYINSWSRSKREATNFCAGGEYFLSMESEIQGAMCHLQCSPETQMPLTTEGFDADTCWSQTCSWMWKCRFHTSPHPSRDWGMQSLNGLLNCITTETLFIYALNRCFSICLNNPSSKKQFKHIKFSRPRNIETLDSLVFIEHAVCFL